MPRSDDGAHAAAVSYRVEIKPPEHELAVEVTLRGPVAEGELLLHIPTWVPGDYTFAPQARDLFDVAARDGDTGEPLTVRRDGWQGYAVSAGQGHVCVTYSASAWGDDLSESAGLVDSEFAITTGARYLTAPAHIGACDVQYVLPDGWQIHHPSGAVQLDGTSWRYPSYEILLDTPVVTGAFQRFRRDVDETPFWFVFVDSGVGFDDRIDAYLDAVARVVDSFHATFGSFPFDDYTFVLSLNPQNDWGLEHLTSTMCGLGSDVFIDDDQFRIGVRVCAHELFHAWNVRRCRPAPLGELATHLTAGAFTEGLWVAEGFTRYYEFLGCVRAGVYTASQFFSNVVGYHRHLTVRPAYERVSATDSSFASYLNHADYAGRVNNGIDYYDKGMLIAFGIDVTLRTEVEDGSLDRSFASFFDQFDGFGPGHPGYTTDDVIDFFGNVHSPLRAQIATAATRPGGLNTKSAFEALGFEVDERDKPQLGLVFQGAAGRIVYGVLDNSPAGRAGVAPGDIITSVDGFTFSRAALAFVAQRGRSVALGIRRGHRQLNIVATPVGRRRIESLVWSDDADRRRRLDAWFGQAANDLIDGRPVDLSFYENFHGIEVVV